MAKKEPLATEVLIETLRNYATKDVMIKADILENVAGRLEIYRSVIRAYKDEVADLKAIIKNQDEKLAQFEEQ